jgi:hypothetical protein
LNIEKVFTKVAKVQEVSEVFPKIFYAETNRTLVNDSTHEIQMGIESI